MGIHVLALGRDTAYEQAYQRDIILEPAQFPPACIIPLSARRDSVCSVASSEPTKLADSHGLASRTFLLA